MKLDDHRISDEIEDRRGGMGAGGSIGIGMVALAPVAWCFGIDPQTVLDVAQVAAPAESRRAAPKIAPSDPRGR